MGCESIPFPNARPLPDDNGKHYFGDYMVEHKSRISNYNVNPITKRCQCPCCVGNPRELVVGTATAIEEDETDAETVMIPVGARFADQPNAARKRGMPQLVPPRPPLCQLLQLPILHHPHDN